MLAPSASWDGTVTWVGRTPPSDPARTTFKPIARFAITPFQDVAGDFTIPLLAYCKGGIASVTFWCEGNTEEVLAKSVVSEYQGRDFEAYTVTLDHSIFPAFNGPFDVYATVTPVDVSAQARVVSLRLYHDKGDAPATVKYVSNTGIDSSGRGDDPSTPYLTISYAKDQLRLLQGGDLGGGRIKLASGNYQYGGDVENFDRLAANRWLTIEPMDGAEASLTTNVSSAGIRSQKVRLLNLTIDQSATWTISSNGPLVDYIWIDNCICIGNSSQSSLWHSTAWTERYITDSTVNTYINGPYFPYLARNVTVGGLGSDAFQNGLCIICCDVTDITKSGLDHPDLWQINGIGNALLYGCKFGTGVGAQGVFLADIDVSDVAVVNNLFNFTTDYYTQARGAWTFDHVLFWHNSWVGQHFFIDSDGARNNWSIENNVFYTAAISAFVTPDHNHFASGTLYGTNTSTGDPDWTSTRKPIIGGNLTGVTPLTLIDIDGTTRQAQSTLGPYEAVEPALDTLLLLGVA